MAKVLPGRSLPPDDPMFLGGPEIFSPQGFKPSSTSSAKSTTGATLENSDSATNPQKDHPMQAAPDAYEKQAMELAMAAQPERTEQEQLNDMYARVRQVFPMELLDSMAPQQRTLTDNAINRVLNKDGLEALTIPRLEGIKELVTQHLWSDALTTASKTLDK